MAKGRKRMSGNREANGRVKRPTLAQLKQQEADRYRANMQQVAQQPHRRGARNPMDPRLENALGRFCVAHSLAGELYDAGQEWASICRRWRSAKGVPDPQHTGGMGSGMGPADDTVAAWGKIKLRVERELAAQGDAVWFATRQLCLDCNDLGADQDEAAKIGLHVVAQNLGRLSRSIHPFDARLTG